MDFLSIIEEYQIVVIELKILTVFKMNRTQTIIPFPLEEVVAVVTDPS
jgi:hypothetical protein